PASGCTPVPHHSGVPPLPTRRSSDLAGSATQLVFTGQPSNTAAGVAITPAVQVTARDGQGNTATGFTGNVTVAIGANPSGGTLAGRTSARAESGHGSISEPAICQTGT